jgi:cytochrome c553
MPSSLSRRNSGWDVPAPRRRISTLEDGTAWSRLLRSCGRAQRKRIAATPEAARPYVLRIAAVIALTGLPGFAGAQTIDEKAQLCAACHGENGAPQQKTTPVIWGQQLGYLYLQLRDFKSGARNNDQMAAVTAGLERDDMLALAQYFSQKPWTDLQQPRASGEVAAQALAVSMAVVCTSCHQEGYKGEGTQPRLAGQEKDYLAQTMADFRDGKRGNNPGMSDLMKSISADELAALADYLSGL